MQVQRILMDPKYNQPLISDSSPPSILLSSPNFDARLCLRLVHQYTSYEDLIRAGDQLENGIEARRGVLKLLVRENFDRFVNAKNSIDAVYADMRGKGMNSGDFGMRPTTASVNGMIIIIALIPYISVFISCFGKISASLSPTFEEKK